MAPDLEARASTFLGAMTGLANLIQGQVPGMAMSSEDIGHLIQLLSEEAQRVVPSHQPAHRAGANDDFDDG